MARSPAWLPSALSIAASAGTRHPQRGGTLQLGSSGDAAGLDAHTHNQNHVSVPTTVMYTGLTDLDQRGNIVPGIAESWEPNQELTAWTFRLRKGVLFHNGREVDAEAVKLNLMRIKDPTIGGDFERGAVDTIDRVEVLDKYTVRIQTTMPDVSLPSNVMHYPTRLMAPDAFDTAADHPIGTGPFKFVSWTRNNEAKMVRFENYWETDAEGHSLPYLEEIIGKPKREPSVRLTALRTGQVQLINTMAQADIERFKETQGDKYNLWEWHGGGQFVVFNFRRGPFQDKRLRLAAAHAIDRQAIHHAVYYGQGAMADQPYPEGNPWHLEGIRSLAYDPDKAKALLKEARAVGTEVKILCSVNNVIGRETAQVVQDQWTTIGFKVTVDSLDTVPLRQARRRARIPRRSRATPSGTTRTTFLRAICTPRASTRRSCRGGRMRATISWWKRPSGRWTRPGARSCTPRPGTSSTSSCRSSTCMKSPTPRRRPRRCGATSRARRARYTTRVAACAPPILQA